MACIDPAQLEIGYFEEGESDVFTDQSFRRFFASLKKINSYEQCYFCFYPIEGKGNLYYMGNNLLAISEKIYRSKYVEAMVLGA